MFYQITADGILALHFIWILFMLAGFLLTIRGFLHEEFFDRWLFRSFHLAGIAIVAVLGMIEARCPLTVWENILRAKYDPSLTYPGSCILHYVQKLVYPDINPLLIRIPTTCIAVFTVVMFIVRPPAKIRGMLRRRK